MENQNIEAGQINDACMRDASIGIPPLQVKERAQGSMVDKHPDISALTHP
jgi:hypothetical protein